MDKMQSLQALSALAQETRLDIFRLLVQVGATGLYAGEIAKTLHVRQNTLSSNLAQLSRAGLLLSRREGRSIRYYAHLDGMRALLAFLMEDCCAGHPDICRSLLDDITCAD